MPVTSRPDLSKGSTRRVRHPLSECRGGADLGPEEDSPARHALCEGTAVVSLTREGEEESTALTGGGSTSARARFTGVLITFENDYTKYRFEFCFLFCHAVSCGASVP